jgi:hypothetical protein
MRLRTSGGVGGSSGDAAIGDGVEDVELLEGLEPDMKEAGDVQGLLTSGSRSVACGVTQMASPSSC